jgi:hypothetical protein
MKDIKLSREEQETIILGNAASKEWDICTADPRMIRKFEKQGYKQNDRENPWGYISFTLPYSKVSIRKEGKGLVPKHSFKPKAAEEPRVSGSEPLT